MHSIELEKAYDPKSFEDRIYRLWEESGAFGPGGGEVVRGARAFPAAGKSSDGAAGGSSEASASAPLSPLPYVITIPPPNVTGVLHLGHALNMALQDIVIRYHRMAGEPTLWVPGTDHAGIATQNVVEKKLRAEGKSRRELGREAFVERTWEVKKEHHAVITRQMRRMGVSVDWGRERFTMDAGLSRAVREVFCTLYERGLLYKGTYLVNWCSSCGTALSDDEVEHEDTKGKMYHIRYPIVGGGEPGADAGAASCKSGGEAAASRSDVQSDSQLPAYIEIATTRPETLLGDTAVAVHPEDERYAGLVGRLVKLPLTDRTIPVIADSYVDRAFGTGVVKITPAHDPNDWEVGKRHGLEVINILTPDGRLNDAVPRKYRGLSVAAAREAVIADLEAVGLFIRAEDITHAVGHCYRCHTVIEPYQSEQWFVRMKPLAEKALAAWRDGDIVFYPRKWENTYRHWLENIRDWCVSRQLWWGHRIPAWYCSSCGKTSVCRDDLVSCPHCGSTDIKQDEDVLDTWFSSWLWPFSTLGWPDAGGKGEEVKAVLEGPAIASVRSKDLPIENRDIIHTARAWHQRHPIGLVNTKVGTVLVSNNSIKDCFCKKHLLYPNKLYVLPVLPLVMEKGAFLGSLPNLFGENILSHYFAAPVELDGKRLFVFVRVRSELNGTGKHLYAHHVFSEEEIKKAGDVQAAAALFKQHIGRPTDLYKSIINRAFSVNPPSDLGRFYPTTALITAYDILFFWVSRMIMAGLEFTGKAPFRDVYIHGLVRDKQGRKMSKSLGNGIDPLDLIDEYGADALKFTLAFLCAQGQDILIDRESFKLGSKFANKVWNASRYILLNLEGRVIVENSALAACDRWIYSRLAGAAASIAEALRGYRYNEAASTAYEFFWNDFCDWYVEATKLSTRDDTASAAEKDRAVTVLLDVLSQALRLLHPFLPFVTEEIWGKLQSVMGNRESAPNSQLPPLLITSPWPTFSPETVDTALEADFAFIQEITRGIRTLRAEAGVTPDKKLRVELHLPDQHRRAFAEENTPLVKLLAGLSEVVFSTGAERPQGALALAGSGFEAFVFVAAAVDLAALKAKFTKSLEKDTGFISSLERKLANEAFLKNAPPELVAAERTKLAQARERSGKLASYLRDL